MRTALLIFMLAILSSSAYALEYYADVNFDVDQSGSVLVRGLTNHPNLTEKSTQEFTSKKGEFWVFELGINDTFSNFVYTVNLPPGAEINYVKGSTPVRIGGETRPFIKSSGKNVTLRLTVQYRIEKSDQSNPLLIPIIAGGSIVALVAGFFIMRARSKKSNLPQSQRTEDAVPEAAGRWYDLEILTERQKQIVDIMEQHGKPITQKQLETQMSIPKSSLSRNIESLVQRGIIKKESRGMTNVLFISQKRPEL